jgi:hypothetical protein
MRANASILAAEGPRRISGEVKDLIRAFT